MVGLDVRKNKMGQTKETQSENRVTQKSNRISLSSHGGKRILSVSNKDITTRSVSKNVNGKLTEGVAYCVSVQLLFKEKLIEPLADGYLHILEITYPSGRKRKLWLYKAYFFEDDWWMFPRLIQH